MTELEKIKAYIEKTNCDVERRYRLRFDEAAVMAKQDPYHMVNLAFKYGKAKGYRAAKAEMKAKQRAEVR